MPFARSSAVSEMYSISVKSCSTVRGVFVSCAGRIVASTVVSQQFEQVVEVSARASSSVLMACNSLKLRRSLLSQLRLREWTYVQPYDNSEPPTSHELHPGYERSLENQQLNLREGSTLRYLCVIALS